MNPDEIVKTLRGVVNIIDDCDGNLAVKALKGHMANAADLIESQQAQISQLAAERDAAVDDILIAVDERTRNTSAARWNYSRRSDMRLVLCPACAGKFTNKTQITIHQIADKCQGGCRKRAMCLVWDVEVDHDKT